MGKIFIIKGADFSSNAIGSVDVPSGGSSSGSSGGSSSGSTSGTTSAIKWAPQYGYTTLYQGAGADNPFIMYVGSGNYMTTTLAAIDVSAYSGRTLRITTPLSTNNEGTHWFAVADTSDWEAACDFANIANWSPENWPDTYYNWRALYFGSKLIACGSFSDSGTAAVTVPTGAKWLVFDSGDTSHSQTSFSLS